MHCICNDLPGELRSKFIMTERGFGAGYVMQMFTKQVMVKNVEVIN